MADNNTKYKELAQVPLASAITGQDSVLVETGNSVERIPLPLLAAHLTEQEIHLPDETVRMAILAYNNTTFKIIEEDYPE